MNEIILRTMQRDDRAQVAHLLHASTNAWYQKNRNMPIFTGPPSDCDLFCQVYEDLDSGQCLLAVDSSTQIIAGSCFVHPRPTHISVGIVNTHPDYFGLGIARRLLERVISDADAMNLPVRLVSSAMNLDSFSLYTRLGFVPRMAFQDMFLPVEKVAMIPALPESDRIRPAILNDAPAMASLERELVGIERETDYAYFLKNRDNLWSASLLENEEGEIEGFLISIVDPASTMLGPGVARTDDGAAALIRAELLKRSGFSPVFLVPADQERLVRRLYSWGARNCEIHFAQIRGAWQKPTGIVMPTFMPETG